MKRVAVLGGGPAGAYAAEQLASAGLAVSVFDEKLAWEKPCGGGLTHKAYARYPFLADSRVAKRYVTEMVLAAPHTREARLELQDPLLIYSRLDLNRMMLERAERAGAQLEKTRVLEISWHAPGWTLRTKTGTATADFCVVATGARNSLRNAGTRMHAQNIMCALGYYVPGHQAGIDIQFLPHLHGYLWIFPRCGHLSAGICGKGEASSSLRQRLDRYLAQRGIPTRDAQFYSHVIPSLDVASWQSNRVAGDGWVAAGDAAGLVDPITGEGLYYAIRSGDLAAQAILAERPADYPQMLRQDFARDLEHGARLSERIYGGKFLLGGIPTRMIQFARRSPRFRHIVEDLMAGRQPYLELKRRLVTNLHGSLYEMAMSRLLSRISTTRN